MQRSVALVLLLLPSLVEAEYVPVTPGDLSKLVAAKARLYPVRPCRGRGPGQAIQLYPGDVVVAAARHHLSTGSPPSPSLLMVEVPGRVRQVLHIEDLSRRPLPYSYRSRQSFDAFWTGLATDSVHLMELYQKVISRHGYRTPGYHDAEDDWHRLQHLRRQLDNVRMRLFDIAYGHHDERRLIEREKDWLPAKGEDFITQYAGQLGPEKRKRMQAVYGAMNSLANVPSFCSKIGTLQQAIEQPKEEGKYAGLEPAHRARLQAEDIARLHTEITEIKAKVVVTLTEARARLLLSGVKAR